MSTKEQKSPSSSSKSPDSQRVMWHNGKDSPRLETVTLTPTKPPNWNDEDDIQNAKDDNTLKPIYNILTASRAMKDMPWLMCLSQPESVKNSEKGEISDQTEEKENNRRDSSSNSSSPGSANSVDKRVYKMHISTEGIAHLVDSSIKISQKQ